MNTPKLTPELEANLIQLLQAGNYVKTACAVVGIHFTTFYEWKKVHPGFAAKVERAMAKAESDVVFQWQSFTAEDWRACKEFLQARYPKKWGVTRHLKVDQTTTTIDASDILKEFDKTSPAEPAAEPAEGDG